MAIFNIFNQQKNEKVLTIVKELQKTHQRRYIIIKKILLLVALLPLSSCYRDVEIIKKNAPKFLKQRGYTIISYDGYESNLMMAGNGGFVSYQVRDSKYFVYTIEICEWNGEYHIYNQKCLNAVSNK